MDKERANFCDYFRFRVGTKGGAEPGSGGTKSDEARRKLGKLFGA